jgi:hypothetical protein
MGVTSADSLRSLDALPVVGRTKIKSLRGHTGWALPWPNSCDTGQSSPANRSQNTAEGAVTSLAIAAKIVVAGNCRQALGVL